jgi:hypothetical protein
MKGLRRRAGLLGLGALTAIAVAIPSGSAHAQTLNGVWATYNNCPVTAPSMLAADGANIYDDCLDSNAPSGTMTLGNTTVTLGDSDLQVGVLVNTTTTPISDTAVAPSGGAITAAPVTIPGGLLGLMCPTDVPLVSLLCAEITDSALNTVTATIQPAGSPSGLHIGAGFTQGKAIITIPVMIQLSNPILGSDCYIGSDSDPIDLTIENSVAPPNANLTFFDANGTEDPNGVFVQDQFSGGTQVAEPFSVPGASGCGPLGIADPVVDLKEGLPAASGNSLTLNSPVESIAGYNNPQNYAPDEGQDLAAAYESAES